jgi:hypothetical protein
MNRFAHCFQVSSQEFRRTDSGHTTKRSASRTC